MRELPDIAASERSALFVMQGDLARIKADGYLIPGDSRQVVGARWRGVMRDPSSESRRQPPLVAQPRRVAVVEEDDRTHFLADIVAAPGMVDRMVEGVQQVLAEAQQRWERKPPQSLRERPLFAMPLVATGRGGLHTARGAAIRALLGALRDLLPTLDFDIVLVCWERSSYAAVQRARRDLGLGDAAILPPQLAAAVDPLIGAAQRGALSVLFGAGVSMPLGLPSWKSLLDQLAANTGLTRLDELDVVEAASLVVEELGADAFPKKLAELVSIDQHSLSHGLLASLRPTVAVTTNYDQGYEIALNAARGRSESVPVLPFEWPDSPGQVRVLKLHGDSVKGSVVLSRAHFVEMHATRRPLTALLQDQMLSGHVLALGTSMSDSTLSQAVSEAVALLRAMGTPKDRLGTYVATQDHPARRRLLEGIFTVAAADEAWTKGAEPASLEQAARRVDLFLDVLGAQSSDDLSYVADRRYSDLVDDGRHIEVAEQARSLRALVEPVARQEPGFRRLLQALDDIGAGESGPGPTPSRGESSP
jgi:hypothetical protein